MADQYHIDSNIVTTSDSIEPVAGLVVNSTMTDSQSVISNVTTGGVGAKGDKGDTGATGLKGDKGDTGLTGAAGTNGQGVPTGGTTGQQLAKINGTDYNTQWVNPVDISGKQDTLVSGTSIKTVNSTSLLGSGDIVIGGAVDSVNTQTGAVVLDTDDIAEGTNKYVTSAEKTILSNTSGVNTGDQVVPAQFNPIAGSNVTLTGTYPNVTFNSSGGGTWGSITGTLSSQTDLNSALGGKFDKTGGVITQTGSNSGYVDIRSGPTGNRSSFSLTGNGSPNAGDTMTFQMRNDIGDVIAFVYDLSASTYHDFLRFDYLNDKVSFPHMLPFSNLTYDLGSSSAYFSNTYTQKLYLNSTAYLDGSTAGVIDLTGNLALSGADTTVSLTGVTSEPSAPSTGQLKIYSKKIAGKMFPKTVGPSGIDSPLQNAFWQNNICIWQPTTASNGLWLGTAPAGAGTYATVLPTSTSLYTAMKRGRWSNIATTANQVLTQRSVELMYFLGNSAGMGGFFFYTRMGFDTWTDGGRLFAGLFNGNSLIQSDPSTVNNNIGFAVDVADNGLIYFQTKGTGAAVRTSTGFTITSGSGYDMYIFAAPNSTTVSWRILEINTGTEATGSSAVSGPAVNVNMMAGIQASNAALTSVNAIQLCINRIYVETDR